MGKKEKNKRILMCVLGVLVCGISVGFFKCSLFGVDPFQTFMGGLDAVVPIQFGTLYVIANLVLLSFSFFADRHYVGLATFVNLFFLGYVVQYSQAFLNWVFPDPHMGIRLVFLVIAVVVMCLSSAFYFTADLGVSTYDAVSLIISKTWNKMEFKYCRIASDLVCVVIGVTLYLFSGQGWKGVTSIVGIGTIITAFCMGPLIEFFNVHVARPFLEGMRK